MITRKNINDTIFFNQHVHVSHVKSMGIPKNYFQIKFSKNSHVRFWKSSNMLCTRALATTWHVSYMGRFKSTCHVATCLKGEPPGKSDIGTLWVVWHGNDFTHGHQIGAADEHMSPACRTRGHVAHVLLHVPRQPVNFRDQIYSYWVMQGYGVIAVRLSVLMMWWISKRL